MEVGAVQAEKAQLDDAQPLQHERHGGDDLGLDPALVVEESHERKATVAKVRDALAESPTRPRAAHVYWQVKGLDRTSQEAADELGVSGPRVRQHVMTARTELMQIMAASGRWTVTENELDEALETLLETPAGPERDKLLANLSQEQRTVVARMLEIDDLVWETAHGAPPLESDPVAAMLGLVPDASFRLD